MRWYRFAAMVKVLYIRILLFFLARGFAAASHFIPEVRRELAYFNHPLLLILRVWPKGPAMYLRFSSQKISLASRKETPETRLEITIKNLSAAFALFTFQEGTAVAFARARMTVSGNLGQAMAFVRCLNWVEFYLLPALLARLALKEYPTRNLGHKIIVRTRLYLSLLFVS
jgi:hypothetical protein